MSHQDPGNQSRDFSQMTEFGIFYPLGYLVVALPKEEDARQVQRDLMTGGYDEADCQLFTCEEVVAAARRNLAENTGFLARLGWADEAVKAHLDAARQGSAFLLIYAPGDTETARALNVIRRVPFDFAHRYHRFAIEELK
ncbi:uncharacterized protein sS8_3137 [Methylocaldum marinum]|uniref:Uncharacterized protein n=1 Tax=Methylocaldum marinum TaxID=1432792 RepID=A0A250KTV3_9GAMM|nr:hypothetical protein [Methylocaldum marinum]BBA35080.1 uncharacterized protein sS8_3137 [Methylocaldum marinum]